MSDPVSPRPVVLVYPEPGEPDEAAVERYRASHGRQDPEPIYVLVVDARHVREGNS